MHNIYCAKSETYQWKCSRTQLLWKWRCVPKDGQSEDMGWGYFYGCWEYKNKQTCEEALIQKEIWIGPRRTWTEDKKWEWKVQEAMTYWCVDSKGNMVLWNECKGVPQEGCIPE